MSEPLIRRALPEDAERLSAISRRTFTETFGHLYPPSDLAGFLESAYAPARLAGELADPRVAAWLVERDGEAVGHALAGPCGLPHPEVGPGSGELKRLYLTRAVQNGGLGGRLFDVALDWLARGGARDLWIGVWSENHGARRFYGRRGFEKVGEYDFRVGATADREFILRRTDR